MRFMGRSREVSRKISDETNDHIPWWALLYDYALLQNPEERIPGVQMDIELTVHYRVKV